MLPVVLVRSRRPQEQAMGYRLQASGFRLQGTAYRRVGEAASPRNPPCALGLLNLNIFGLSPKFSLGELSCNPHPAARK